MERNKRVTMQQIADIVGVSAMAVSKALNNRPGVSPATRERILSVAGDLHYAPNLLAKSFRTDRTNTVGVLISNEFRLVFTPIFDGMGAAAGRNGYSIITAYTGDGREKVQEALGLMVGKRVDGLILTSPFHFGEEEAHWLREQSVPFVLTMRSYPDSDVCTVLNDNKAGAMAMAEYLVKKGGRRFLVLSLDQRFYSTGQRMQGWLSVLEEHGIALPPGQVEYLHPEVEEAYAAIKRRLQRGLKWDTVICGCDTLAVGAIEALLDAGVDVPGQVRVSGYDDIPMAAYLRRPLTTVRQPLQQIGEESMNLLLSRIEEPEAPGRQLLLANTLVVRGSA